MPKINTDQPASDDQSQNVQSMFGDDSGDDGSGDDSTPGSTQDQMSAEQVSIKKKKTNPHAYTVKWS